MNTTEYQKRVLTIAREKGTVTTQDVAAFVMTYHNESKYAGQILTRLVNRGLLERVKPGVYRIPDDKLEIKEGLFENLNK